MSKHDSLITVLLTYNDSHSQKVEQEMNFSVIPK